MLKTWDTGAQAYLVQRTEVTKREDGIKVKVTCANGVSLNFELSTVGGCDLVAQIGAQLDRHRAAIADGRLEGGS